MKSLVLAIALFVGVSATANSKTVLVKDLVQGHQYQLSHKVVTPVLCYDQLARQMVSLGPDKVRLARNTNITFHSMTIKETSAPAIKYGILVTNFYTLRISWPELDESCHGWIQFKKTQSVMRDRLEIPVPGLAPLK